MYEYLPETPVPANRPSPLLDDDFFGPAAAAAIGGPGHMPPATPSPAVHLDAADYAEALRQTRPLIGTRIDAAQARVTIQRGNAHPRGIKDVTARSMVFKTIAVRDIVKGPHPGGKAAEVAAIRDWRELHAGNDPGMVNAPERVATNVRDIRLSPDTQSRKDLIFQFDTADGRIISRYNGQVKTGSGAYVADSISEMAQSDGYGKVAYIDSRFVNNDGSPRVASDGFTESQARRVNRAGVRLRGIKNLESRAKRLVENINKGSSDGLDPVARAELAQLREDIARAYSPKGTATRVIGGAAMAAATAALISLVVQYLSSGSVDGRQVGGAAGKAAIFGAAGAAVDSAVYHVAVNLGAAPEAAKAIAGNVVAGTFAGIAIASDLYAEVASFRAGEIDAVDAVAGTSAKAALDLLPFALAPLGLVGVPILVAAQMGGRWVIGTAREQDARVSQAVIADLESAAILSRRLDEDDARQADCIATSSEVDALVERTLGNLYPLQLSAK